MTAYGLLGRTLGHSFSPQIHAALGNNDYSLIEREPEELDDFFHDPSWKGINVTIPYKETVMPYCDEIDGKARAIGCVNTIIRRADGSLFATNTDYDGLSWALDHAGITVNGRKCLLLGNGATSRTIRAVLSHKAAGEVVQFGRHNAVPYEDIDKHRDAQVILNATPVGMFPHTPNSLISLSGLDRLQSVFDVIYNPHRTRLLLDARAKGLAICDGLPMLVAQAAFAAHYFTGLASPEEKILPVLGELRRELDNIVLIGMPGVGKSKVGETVAGLTGRTFIDIDTRLSKELGAIDTFIRQKGEAAFREAEHRIINEIGKSHGLVIATGGGAVTRPDNYAPLAQNGRIYWLERPLEVLSTTGRPLSEGGLDALRRLYSAREPLYRAFCDVRIDHNGIERSARRITEEFYEAMHH